MGGKITANSGGACVIFSGGNRRTENILSCSHATTRKIQFQLENIVSNQTPRQLS
jgi:hypothetical protein